MNSGLSKTGLISDIADNAVKWAMEVRIEAVIGVTG